MKIVLLGSGNLATNLGHNLYKNGWEIIQVYSKTKSNAEVLARGLHCDFTDDIDCLYDADIYISALKDSVATRVWQQTNFKDKLLIHTSGSLSLEVLSPHSRKTAVLYPLMTLSKGRILDFENVPFLIEANSNEQLAIVKQMAESMSSKVQIANSKQREQIHLAAVWANNFSNHMFAVSKIIAENNSIPFSLLLPLIDETVNKIHHLDPIEAQTGPAIRFDENIINKHLENCPLEYRNIYKEVSESIHQLSKK